MARDRVTRRIAALSLVLAAGCAKGAPSEPDGAAGNPPDASVPPDAPIGFPDAMPGTPDAAPGAPDAMPGTPDAMPSPPDAMPGTPDAMPTPDAGCTDVILELLTNGNYDSGAVNWVENGAGYPIVLSTTDPTYPLPVTPDTGNYAAWMGGVDSATRTLHQDVVVPAGTSAITLTGRRYIATEEIGTTVYDSWRATIRNTAGVVLENGPVLTNVDANASWITWSHTLTGSYAGMALRVHLSNTNDFSFNTNFFIDTVALRATVCQ